MKTVAQRMAPIFVQLAADGANAAAVADTACAVWHCISAALSPTIGHQGVAALHKRSLHLARAADTELPVPDVGDGTTDFAALREALAGLTAAAAISANEALLDSFYTILSNLIGVPLKPTAARAGVEPGSRPIGAGHFSMTTTKTMINRPPNRPAWARRGPRLFQIDDQGIHVGAALAGYEGLLGGRPTKRLPAWPAAAGGPMVDPLALRRRVRASA